MEVEGEEGGKEGFNFLDIINHSFSNFLSLLLSLPFLSLFLPLPSSSSRPVLSLPLPQSLPLGFGEYVPPSPEQREGEREEEKRGKREGGGKCTRS
jgi:hypothetical protein